LVFVWPYTVATVFIMLSSTAEIIETEPNRMTNNPACRQAMGGVSGTERLEGYDELSDRNHPGAPPHERHALGGASSLRKDASGAKLAGFEERGLRRSREEGRSASPEGHKRKKHKEKKHKSHKEKTHKSHKEKKLHKEHKSPKERHKSCRHERERGLGKSARREGR
jgi:hypothetical protein